MDDLDGEEVLAAISAPPVSLRGAHTMLEAETTEDLSFNFDFKTILIHNILKVSRQKQQKLPDCLSRENGFGKPGLHRSNFGGISGRKDACDFPKPFHILWQNSKFVNIIFFAV